MQFMLPQHFSSFGAQVSSEAAAGSLSLGLSLHSMISCCTPVIVTQVVLI